MRRLPALIFGALFILPVAAWCADLFVQSNTAPLLATPSLAGEKLMVLKQGVKVAHIQKKGMWQKVKYNQMIGWIYALMLGPNPPLTPYHITTDQVDQMAESARKRPSAYASTAAARGLMHQRKRLGQKLKYDFEALERMESYAADEKETLKFIKERDHQ